MLLSAPSKLMMQRRHGSETSNHKCAQKIIIPVVPEAENTNKLVLSTSSNVDSYVTRLPPPIQEVGGAQSGVTVGVGVEVGFTMGNNNDTYSQPSRWRCIPVYFGSASPRALGGQSFCCLKEECMASTFEIPKNIGLHSRSPCSLCNIKAKVSGAMRVACGHVYPMKALAWSQKKQLPKASTIPLVVSGPCK